MVSHKTGIDRIGGDGRVGVGIAETRRPILGEFRFAQEFDAPVPDRAHIEIHPCEHGKEDGGNRRNRMIDLVPEEIDLVFKSTEIEIEAAVATHHGLGRQLRVAPQGKARRDKVVPQRVKSLSVKTPIDGRPDGKRFQQRIAKGQFRINLHPILIRKVGGGTRSNFLFGFIVAGVIQSQTAQDFQLRDGEDAGLTKDTRNELVAKPIERAQTDAGGLKSRTRSTACNLAQVYANLHRTNELGNRAGILGIAANGGGGDLMQVGQKVGVPIAEGHEML